MADKSLAGMKVAILVTDGFEQVELTEPREALDAAGAQTQVVSPKPDRVRGWDRKDRGGEVSVDLSLKEAASADFDALVLPGGVLNPDFLRMDEDAIAFVQDFLDADKPIAAICHGPWTLIETGKLRGRSMTSWPSLETDLQNAGVNWHDRETVVDGNLLTSRKPDDLPAFNREMVALFGRAGARGASARAAE